LRAAAGRSAKSFSFRARRPLFDDAPFTVNLAPVDGGCELWACDAGGVLAMDARLELAP
jgi:hydroxyacyl-ACP dehydratase HTD2-like protein with hotdog domain